MIKARSLMLKGFHYITLLVGMAYSYIWHLQENYIYGRKEGRKGGREGGMGKNEI